MQHLYICINGNIASHNKHFFKLVIGKIMIPKSLLPYIKIGEHAVLRSKRYGRVHFFRVI